VKTLKLRIGSGMYLWSGGDEGDEEYTGESGRRGANVAGANALSVSRTQDNDQAGVGAVRGVQLLCLIAVAPQCRRSRGTPRPLPM
jgi:hypothetical protein